MAGPSWDSPAVKGQDGLAMLSTALSATEPPVTSYTCVKSVAPVTAPASAPAGTVWLTKPTPWTLLRPFILERELSNHPNKAFVKQLINDLCHGCLIGYKGPQFPYCATNLVSAFQHPEVIDATLEKETHPRTVSESSLTKFPDIGTRLSPQTRWWVEDYLPFICTTTH